MLQTLDQLESEGLATLSAAPNAAALEAWRIAWIGSSGKVRESLAGLKSVPKEQRPAVGARLNAIKTSLERAFETRKSQLGGDAARPVETLDMTEPGLVESEAVGRRHIITRVRDELVEVFARMGFQVATGPELEDDDHNFIKLNIPADHPARDAQDTFYFPATARFGNVSKKNAEEKYLLRTHTSSVQIRTMLKGEPPIRIVSPGRVYRRDTSDATHSANFHQLECLYVDKNVTVRDLKALLDYIFASLLGKDTTTRFRPHYFGYTEPSFEVDLSAKHLPKVKKEWIEIGGCGMVDPTVFAGVGYDPEVWSGYAFGMGLERLAMLMYGIDDIRYFYQNDLRFLRQFA